MGRGKRESLFLLPFVPHVIAIVLLLLFLLGGPSRSLCGTDSTKQAYKGSVLFTATESVELFKLFTLILMPHRNI